MNNSYLFLYGYTSSTNSELGLAKCPSLLKVPSVIRRIYCYIFAVGLLAIKGLAYEYEVTDVPGQTMLDGECTSTLISARFLTNGITS
jgi:hypothetical protein